MTAHTHFPPSLLIKYSAALLAAGSSPGIPDHRLPDRACCLRAQYFEHDYLLLNQVSILSFLLPMLINIINIINIPVLNVNTVAVDIPLRIGKNIIVTLCSLHFILIVSYRRS